MHSKYSLYLPCLYFIYEMLQIISGNCDDNLRIFHKFSKLGIHRAKCLNVSQLYASFNKKRKMVKSKSYSCPAIVQSAETSSGSTNHNSKQSSKASSKADKN